MSTEYRFRAEKRFRVVSIDDENDLIQLETTDESDSIFIFHMNKIDFEFLCQVSDVSLYVLYKGGKNFDWEGCSHEVIKTFDAKDDGQALETVQHGGEVYRPWVLTRKDGDFYTIVGRSENFEWSQT